MKILVLILFFFNFTSNEDKKKKTFDEYFNYYFEKYEIDTTEYSKIFLTSSIDDLFPFNTKLPKEKSFCTDYLIFYPLINNSFEFLELDYLLSLEKATFQDSLNYLNFNNITDQFYAVYLDRSLDLVKLERLGTEININFTKIISTAYYKNNKLVLYYNNECYERIGEKILRVFEYEKEKVYNEIFIIEKNGELKYVNEKVNTK